MQSTHLIMVEHCCERIYGRGFQNGLFSNPRKSQSITRARKTEAAGSTQLHLKLKSILVRVNRTIDNKGKHPAGCDTTLENFEGTLKQKEHLFDQTFTFSSY